MYFQSVTSLIFKTSPITYRLVLLTDNRGRNVIFTTNGHSKHVKIRVSVQTIVTGNSNALFQDGRIVIDSEGFVHIFYPFVC